MVGEATEDEGGGGGAVSQDGVGIWWSQRCRYPSVVPAGACEDDSTKQQRREQLRREEEERKQLRQAEVSEEAARRFLCERTTETNLGPILAILGLRAEPPVPFPTIKRSYRLLCLRLHPDKFKGGDSTAVFQKVQDAYDTLVKEWMQEEERKARQQQEREAKREREARAARNVVNLCSSDDDDDLGVCFSGGSDGRREEGVGGA